MPSIAAVLPPRAVGSRLSAMFESVTRPLRWVLGATEHEVVQSVHEARDIEVKMLGAVHAIETATASIERHVEMIETLATSIDPLRGSVDRLAETLEQLVTLLAPLAAAEHDVERLRHLFGRRRHD